MNHRHIRPSFELLCLLKFLRNETLWKGNFFVMMTAKILPEVVMFINRCFLNQNNASHHIHPSKSIHITPLIVVKTSLIGWFLKPYLLATRETTCEHSTLQIWQNSSHVLMRYREITNWQLDIWADRCLKKLCALVIASVYTLKRQMALSTVFRAGNSIKIIIYFVKKMV